MKKNLGIFLSCPIWFQGSKIFKIMRISILFLLLGLGTLHATISYSQNKRIDLALKDVTLKEAIDDIEKQSEYKFLFRSDLIDLGKTITADVTDVPLEVALETLFSGTDIGYNIMSENLVVLMPLQPQKIAGRVTDGNTGTPLPGVNVVIQGTTTGVTTDINGQYSITALDQNAVLIFSFIGYATQTVPVSGRADFNIKMIPDIEKLDEVVVVGYGTQKKNEITGSVSTVSIKNIEKTAVIDPMQALQGKAAGVDIVSNSGQPGAGYSVQIRGIQSINAGVNPTYVIDGVISNNIGNINTNDIESISVLKDGASSSIYGTRAANGVVLITTKRGKANETPEITFNTYMGVQTSTNRKLKLLNSNQWLKLDQESYENDGMARPYTDADLEKYKLEGGNYRNTDWLDVIMKNGTLKYYDLSVRGGSEKSTYFTSVNYLDQEGRIIAQKANKLNFRFNSDHKINKFLEFGNSLNLYSNSNEGLPDFNGVNSSYAPNPYLQAVRKIPLSKPWEADGSYGINEDQNIEYLWIVPQAIAREYKREASSSGIIGNVYVKFNLAKGLTFTPRAGVTYDYGKTMFFTPVLNVPNSEQILINKIEKGSSNLFHWQMDYMLNYEHSFNQVHNVSALLVYSREEQTYEDLGGNRLGTPSNSIRFLNAGDPGNQINYNGYSDWAFISYIGRINYDYKGKYLLQATVRRDGSSRFSADNRWGIFPSYSLGWRISKEDFFSGITGIVNDLKIRASLGTLGNADIGNYPTYSTLDARTYILNHTMVGGYTLSTAVNKDVKWETTKKYNAGIDALFLKSKVYMTFDYFISKTTNLLFMKPLPESSGKNQWALPYINAGEIQNKGFELELGYRDSKGDWSWDISANMSSTKNNVVDLAGLDQIINTDNNTITGVGQPIFSYFGYKTKGIIQTQKDLDAYKAMLYATDATDITAGLGDVWKVDVDSYDQVTGKLTGKPDGKIDAADRTYIGRRYPSFTYGFVSNLSYKRLSLQIQVQGVSGYDLPINGISLNYFQGLPENSNNVILHRWNAVSNPKGTLPRVTRSDPAGNLAEFSDIWLSDASYLRINNVNLSYDLPQNICNKIMSKGLKVYCSVQNLYTFTNFLGVEPDITLGDSYRGGIAADKMPQARTWIFGLKATF